MPQLFPVKRVAENYNLEFNFESLCPAGKTLVSAVVVASVMSGNDPTPSLIIAGSPTISGSFTVLVPITGGLPGVTYNIFVTATTTNPPEQLVMEGPLGVLT